MDPAATSSATLNTAQFKDEKQLRSVFVGNIPYDSSEDDLKSLFSQIGPIISLRLVYDRETGKAKGYGFCEYADVETANSAIRNLNGCEFRNRHLRVDSASCDKNKDDVKVEEPTPLIAAYTKEVSMTTSEVPEMITNIISNMPSEKIFELLKQIKMCAVDSPDETKEMLIQNPQLAYAILQALLLMNIIDSRTARAIVLDKPLEYSSHIKTFDQVNVEPTQFSEKSPSLNQRIAGVNVNQAIQPMEFPPQFPGPGGLQIPGSLGVSIPPPFVQDVKHMPDSRGIPLNPTSNFKSSNDNNQTMSEVANETANFKTHGSGVANMHTPNQSNHVVNADSKPPPPSSNAALNIDGATVPQYPYPYHHGAPNTVPHPANFWQPNQPSRPPPSSFDPRVGSHHFDNYFEHDDYNMHRGHERYKNYMYRHMGPPPPNPKINYSRDDFSHDARPRNDYYDRAPAAASTAADYSENQNNYYTSSSSHSTTPSTSQDPRLRRSSGPPRNVDITKRSDRRKPRNV